MTPALALSGINAAASLLQTVSSLASPSSTSSSGSAASSGAGATSASGAATGTSATQGNDQLGQSDFLRLFVTQLQNQDPLNPMDSSQFASQLAQFSSLEQLVQINQHLASQTSSTGASSQFDAVSFLGRQVSASGDGIAVTGGNATTVDYTLGASGGVTGVILDANGNQVASLDLGEQAAGDHTLDLSKISNPPHLPDGSYTVQLSEQSGTADPVAVATRISGVVTGVDLSSSDPVLLIGDLKVPLSKVTLVKEAAA
jgi:flagellar basal-body rod modification protein FlgD